MDNYKRLGDYIRLVDNRNKDLAVTNLLGVSIQKKFIKSIANTIGTNMSVYRIIRKNQFAFSPVTSRNGEKITIALLKDEKEAILSPAYQVFEIIDNTKLIPEYLFIWFNRPEFDRYARFNSWGSARETFTWDDMCNVKLPIPDIKTQKKYVALYKGILNNQKAYEKSLDDLQLICDTYMDSLKDRDLKPISDLIELVDNRNDKGLVTNLLGINVNKVFMPSKAKINKDNLINYKVINKGEFAYSPMQVGRDKTVRVVLYSDDKPAIISPAYSIFRIKGNAHILPEFLMLWFHRPEFNRLGWFISDSSVRASLELERFCDIEVPVPDIKIQEAIVTIYHTLETRKKINEKLKNSIKPLCPVLMRGVVEEMVK